MNILDRIKSVKWYWWLAIFLLLWSVMTGRASANTFPSNAETISLSRLGATTGQTIMTVPSGQTYTILSVRSSNEKNTGIVEVKCESGSKTVFYSASALQANQVYTQHLCNAGIVSLVVTGGGGGDQHNIYVTYVRSVVTDPITYFSPENTSGDFAVQAFILFVIFASSLTFTIYIMRKVL